MLVHLQKFANQELEDRQKELNDQYLWSQTEDEAMKKGFDELWWVREQLTTEKVQEIATLKTVQEELERKATVEITELKKETDYLFIEKV